MGLFLNPVGDPADQQIAAQPGRRCGSVQPASFDLKIGRRQRFECCDPGFNIRPLGMTAMCAILAAGTPAGFPASFL